MSEKFTKAEVGFESPAKGPHHCGQCVHYLGGACAIVQGAIDADDWCEKFKAKKGGRYKGMAKSMATR